MWPLLKDVAVAVGCGCCCEILLPLLGMTAVLEYGGSSYLQFDLPGAVALMAIVTLGSPNVAIDPPHSALLTLNMAVVPPGVTIGSHNSALEPQICLCDLMIWRFDLPVRLPIWPLDLTV